MADSISIKDSDSSLKGTFLKQSAKINVSVYLAFSLFYESNPMNQLL